MRATVETSKGTTEVFGDVMDVDFDAETNFLKISYSISTSETHTYARTYETSEWVSAVIESRAPIDYALPNKPYSNG